MAENGTVHDSPLINSLVVGVGYDSPSVANATGATAGSPGTFTPPGSERPENLAGMTGITANPATAWTVGQYVATQTEDVHWDSAAWVAGRVEAMLMFDPGDHTVEQVLAHLEAHPDDTERVLEAERIGKARVGVLGGE